MAEFNQTQNTIGNNNRPSQKMYIGSIQLTANDKKELQETLSAFQRELSKINMPPTQAAIVNSDIEKTLEETKKEKPNKQTLQTRLQDVFNTIKEALGADNAVSKWDLTKKIFAIAGKIGLSLIL